MNKIKKIMIGLVLVAVAVSLATLLTPVPAWFLALDVAYVISAILWVIAGYSFTNIGSSLNETVESSAKVGPVAQAKA